MLGRTTGSETRPDGRQTRDDRAAAMAQLRARGYADRYRAPGRSVHLTGIEICAGRREMTAFDVEPA